MLVGEEFQERKARQTDEKKHQELNSLRSDGGTCTSQSETRKELMSKLEGKASNPL